MIFGEIAKRQSNKKAPKKYVFPVLFLCLSAESVVYCKMLLIAVLFLFRYFVYTIKRYIFVV